MARKYFRISEVVTVCSVTREFILSLEQESVITSVTRKKEKVYPLDQVDRIRVAHNLMGEMGVNLEGVEVVLHMREQIVAMRRQLARMINQSPKRARK
jgi:MerR family transcriptional regulator, heat shock protein HspR